MCRQTRNPSPPRPFERLAAFLLATTLLTALESCAVLLPSPPRSGGSTLSDAARESKSEGEKKRDLEAGRRKDPPICVAEEVVAQSCDPPESYERDIDPEPRRPFQGHIGLIGGAGTLSKTPDGGFGMGGVQFGGYPGDRWRVDLALLGLGADLSRRGGPVSALEHPFEMAGDVSARYHLTPGHARVGVYPLVGFRFGTQFWNYAKPLDVHDDGGSRTVQSDWVNYYAPYAGFGTTVIQLPHLELGLHVTGGMRFYEGYSHEGFRNDLFKDSGFVQLMFETSVPF